MKLLVLYLSATVSLLCATSLAEAGLISHWPLDGSADDVFDGHDGIASAGVTFGEGGANANTGTSAKFANGVIDVDHSTDLNSESFTVTLWTKPTGGSDYRSPITSRLATTGTTEGYILYIRPNNVWDFWTGDGETVVDSWDRLTGPAVQFDVWTHVAMTYDAPTHTKSLFINGNLAATTTDQGYVPVSNTDRDFHIGAGGDLGNQYFWPGNIDDVGFWNEALDQSAIMDVMVNGVPEPGTLILAALGLIGALACRRRWGPPA